MEPDVDRVRRYLGIGLVVLVFGGILGGIALLGRIVGDAIGTAYVGKGPSAEGLPYPTDVLQESAGGQTPPGGVEPIPPYSRPSAAPARPSVPQTKPKSRRS
jgi:hypothetical protein